MPKTLLKFSVQNLLGENDSSWTHAQQNGFACAISKLAAQEIKRKNRCVVAVLIVFVVVLIIILMTVRRRN